MFLSLRALSLTNTGTTDVASTDTTNAVYSAGETPQPYTNIAQPTDMATGYCDLAKHILLLFFTFGIWFYIWIYRMTGLTNHVAGEEDRNPTNKLLLCLFVPFYLNYWIYKTAIRMDKMAKASGISSDLSTICLILSFFIPIVPPILMQEKMNGIIQHNQTTV